jgi:thymidine kinase
MGKIEVFIGPMFAGKTTSLIKRVKELESQGKTVKVFKPSVDNRYGESVICTHDKLSLNAYSIKRLEEIKADDVDAIVVDEFHFFPSSLLDLCIKWKKSGKHVILAGLNFDHQGNPIRFKDSKKDSEDMKRIADEIHLLKSKCAICGKEATMTERTAKTENYFLVGGTESYRPVCEEHHPKWKK